MTGATVTAGAPVLNGVRIVEFEGLGPVPFAGMLLADMGAEVVRIARDGRDGPAFPVLDRGRRIVTANLKDPAEAAAVARLIARADIVIEGFRPGVLERLGFSPDTLLSLNPRLVIGRMTGWGQEGPATAGHDLNYISLTGALAAIGPAEGSVPPLNLVGDYGGGALYLVAGVLAAYASRLTSGLGQVVDCAMVDGAASMMALFHDLHHKGRWQEARRSNTLDGGAPFYDVYTCADGRQIALAAMEPAFFRTFCDIADLPEWRGRNHRDAACWPALRKAITARFLDRNRDDWCAMFDGSDACVTPVLTMREAWSHPQNLARDLFREVNGITQPNIAPRFPASGATIRPARRATLAEVSGSWSEDLAR